MVRSIHSYHPSPRDPLTCPCSRRYPIARVQRCQSRFWRHWLGGPLPSADTMGTVHSKMDAGALRDAFHQVYGQLKRNKALPDNGGISLSGYPWNCAHLRNEFSVSLDIGVRNSSRYLYGTGNAEPFVGEDSAWSLGCMTSMTKSVNVRRVLCHVAHVNNDFTIFENLNTACFSRQVKARKQFSSLVVEGLNNNVKVTMRNLTPSGRSESQKLPVSLTSEAAKACTNRQVLMTSRDFKLQPIDHAGHTHQGPWRGSARGLSVRYRSAPLRVGQAGCLADREVTAVKQSGNGPCPVPLTGEQQRAAIIDGNAQHIGTAGFAVVFQREGERFIPAQ